MESKTHIIYFVKRKNINVENQDQNHNYLYKTPYASRRRFRYYKSYEESFQG